MKNKIYLINHRIRGVFISINGKEYKVASDDKNNIYYYDENRNLQSVSVGLLF